MSCLLLKDKRRLQRHNLRLLQVLSAALLVFVVQMSTALGHPQPATNASSESDVPPEVVSNIAVTSAPQNSQESGLRKRPRDATAQPPVPWEYQSYRCNVWLSVSPKLNLSHDATEMLHRDIRNRLEADFGGTCDWNVAATPDSLYTTVLNRVDSLTLEQILARETTLVIAKSEAAKANFLELSGGNSLASLSEAEIARRAQMSPAQRKEIEDAQARAASLNSVRTLDSAINRIPTIHILPLAFAGLQREMAHFANEEKWSKLVAKLQEYQGNTSDLMQSLEDGQVLAALVPKSDVTKLADVARGLPTRLPWQPEAMLRESDKIFFVSIDMNEGQIVSTVKELDSLVNHVGPSSKQTLSAVNQLASNVTYQIKQSFSSLVRIEETDPQTATLRVRAGGLIFSPNHPAGFEVGDVIQPFIRRTDVNGNPTLVQPIAFTYVAATEQIDQRALMYGAIFTASQGALTAAKNRRTERLGLKISVRSDRTNLVLNYRPTVGTPIDAPPISAPGIEIFERVPGLEGMQSVGRTDWRGRLTIQSQAIPRIKYKAPHTSSNKAVAQARQTVLDPVPEPIYIETRVEPPKEEPTDNRTDASAGNSSASSSADPNASHQSEASSQSKSEGPSKSDVQPQSDASSEDNASAEGSLPEANSNEAETASEQANKNESLSDATSEASRNVESGAGGEADGTPTTASSTQQEPNLQKKVEGEVELKVPLYLYYVKSGDVLLARIPIVVGATPTVTATLPDDRRRLETEAYLKGLQSEILDLVVRRKILEARFRKAMTEGRTEAAKAVLDELKRTKSYDRVTEDLFRIQNRALHTDRGPIGPNLEKRIRSMVDGTRQLIDKWLQEDLVRKFENEFASRSNPPTEQSSVTATPPPP